MKAVLFNSLESALSFQSTIDATMGYPVDNTNIEGDPVDNSITQHISYIKQHPSGSSVWAYMLWNGTLDVVPPQFSIVDLDDAEWFPVRSP